MIEAPDVAFDASYFAIAGGSIESGETLREAVQFPAQSWRRTKMAEIENFAIGIWRNGDAVSVVIDEKTVGPKAEMKFAALENFSVRIAEDGKKNAAGESWIGWSRVPIDVVEVGVAGFATVFENVVPPRIFGTGGHVIGNDVEEQIHAVSVESASETIEIAASADFGVEASGIGNVVAVFTADAGLKSGRSVDVRDAETMQIRNDGLGVLVSEMAIELEAISGGGDAHAQGATGCAC